MKVIKDMFLSVPAIQIGHFISTEEVFQYSKTMMTTMGEWELTGIKSLHQQLPTSFNSTYEELRFFVRINLLL